MKNLRIILILSAVILSFGSCKEDKLSTYDMKDNIYFKHKRWSSPNGITHTTTMEYDGVEYTASARVVSPALDSITYSFALNDKDKDIMIVPVIVVGKIADVDRRFAYKIRPSTTMQEGTDFKVLDAFIPANQTSGGIVVELYKANVSEEGVFGNVDFELIPNENFATAYDSIPRSSASTEIKVSTLTFRLQFSNSLPTPQYWVSHGLGTFTTKKLLCINIAVGLEMDYWYGGTTPSLTLIPAYRQLFVEWLDEMKRSGNEVFEADGTTPMSIVAY